MRSFKLIIAITIFSQLIGNVFAQDDFYPSDRNEGDNSIIIEEVISDDEYTTASDYYVESKQRNADEAYNRRLGITDSTTYYEDEDGNVRITNNYYNGNNYDFSNEYYDYEYSSRIRRFHRNYNNAYYDDYYTNYSYYDRNPYNYGNSIYTSYGWWSPRRSNWNVGWSYYGGWSLGWNWGWGYTGNYGYCGSGYYGNAYSNYGYNPYSSGYNGVYAASYYNSYDRNSYYYGKRGRTSSYSGYKRSNNSGVVAKSAVYKNRTFGQKIRGCC